MSFRFTIKTGPDDEGRGLVKVKNKVREADTWENVPLAAVPVRERNWPAMPEWMNGREYFLWWQNEFKTDEQGNPVVLNPYPTRDNVTYKMGGKESRMWGA